MYGILTLSGQISRSPVTPLVGEAFQQCNVQLSLKRDELLDPEISGNKWRKLKYNLVEAQVQQKSTLLSYGGAFSNHVYAVAAAGKSYGFRTIFLIRGEKPKHPSPTLRFADAAGAQLHFCSRSQYRDPAFLHHFAQQFGDDVYVLPEGGSNHHAIKGCTEIVAELKIQMEQLPDFICLSAGTGATAAGVIAALDGVSQVLIFPALKGDGLEKDIAKMLLDYSGKSYDNWQLVKDYHFGGYAKHKPPLIRFINEFKGKLDIPLDPIYTGKMLFGIFDLVKQHYFPEGSKVVAIHTGGLQGIAGFNERFGEMIK